MKDEVWNLTIVGVGVVLIVSAFWVGRLIAPVKVVERTMHSPIIYYQPYDDIPESIAYQRGWTRGWFAGSGHDEGGR